jgi:ATP-binding cassette subfamily A (ABC1) protein 3
VLILCSSNTGNPRILLLDEPSTGQDAGAKRILWKALQAISANRAILLTTHSMEEAEALATKVAIMGTTMLATGTLGTLQETYGGAYSVRAVRLPTVDSLTAESIIKQAFDNGVSGYADSHGQIIFQLPHDRKMLGAIMKVMEGLKGDAVMDEDEDEEGAGNAGNTTSGSAAAGGSAVRNEGNVVLEHYTIAGPTLEEVFMNVAKEAAITGV